MGTVEIRLGLMSDGRVAEMQDVWQQHGYGYPRRGIGTDRYAHPVSTDLTPQQVAERLARGEIQLIDVRERYENDAGRIAGGRLIELGQLAGSVQTIDRGRPVVFYCRSGSRSAMATEAFRGAGFDAHNMSGGLLDWAAAGLPLEPDDGHVA
jgi:rhodanese-related sulfurtransferase